MKLPPATTNDAPTAATSFAGRSARHVRSALFAQTGSVKEQEEQSQEVVYANFTQLMTA